MSFQYVKDLQRKRVYQAEKDLTAQSEIFQKITGFSSFCKSLCKNLPSSFGNPKSPTIVEGSVPANVAGLAYPDYATWKVVIGKHDPKFALYGTHEMAHLLSHRWCELNDRPWEPHGEIFTAVNLFLIWKHVDRETSIALRTSYASHGVRVTKFSELS